MFYFAKKYPSAIFSYKTDLYFLNLINRVPMEIDITVKKVRGNYCVHRVSDNYYAGGIVAAITPFGNPVKIYNAK